MQMCYYCSSECQLADWKGNSFVTGLSAEETEAFKAIGSHKSLCKRLKALAPAVPVEPQPAAPTPKFNLD
jgi:hypothetical protein